MTARAIDLIGARPPAADWTIFHPETVTVSPRRAGSTVIQAPRKVTIRGGTMTIPPPSVFGGFWFTKPEIVIVHAADGTIKRFTAPLDAADVRGGARERPLWRSGRHERTRSGVGDEENGVGYSWSDFKKDALSTVAKAAGSQTPPAPTETPPVTPTPPPEPFFARKIAGPVRVWHVGAVLGGLVGLGLLARR